MEESIMEERRRIYSDLVLVGRNVLTNAVIQLMEEGYYDPCVAVLYDDERVEFLYPRYKDQEAREEAFNKVNQYIVDTEAVAAVLVMETWFIPKGETVKQEAILLIRQALGVNELEAYPFKRDDDGKGTVTKKLGPSKPDENSLLHAFPKGVS